ncbi:PTS sugar transporter subunit IIA [Acidisoma sp. C75]
MNAPLLSLADILPAGHALAGQRAADKPALLGLLAQRAAPAVGATPASLAAALAAREKLGSTGIGAGLALPHARQPQLSAPLAWMLRLARPLPFDAVDGAPVDLVVLLLSPEGDQARHLAALAALSRRLRQPGIADAIRAAPDPGAMRAILIDA